MGSPRAILAVAVLVVCGAAFFLLRGRGDAPTNGPGRSQGSGPRGPLAVEGAPPTLAAGPRVPKDATADPSTGSASTSADPAASQALDPADRPADWPTTVADGCRTLRLRVRCVDAITGQSVAARWRLGHPFEDAFRRGEPVNPTAGAPGWWLDPRWRAADLRASVLQRPDTLVQDWIVVDAPAGYADVEQFQIHRPVAADIEEISATVPLWPTIDLVLTIRGPDDTPAEGARLIGLDVDGGPPEHWGGTTGRTSDAADAEGTVRLKGLPFVPGAEVRAGVTWPSASMHPTARPAAAPKPDDQRETDRRRKAVLATMPLRGATSFSAKVRLSESTARSTTEGEWVAGELVNLDDYDIVPAEAFVPPDPSTAGRVRVRVFAADGRRVARAGVRSGVVTVETDAAGFAELALAPGRGEIYVYVPGGFRWSAVVEVKAGEAVDVELREPEAGRVDVEIVDEEGLACPFAQVFVGGASGSATYDVEDGVQRLDDLTDAVGKRSFRRVAPGEVSVTAWWRGRAGKVNVVVEERGRVSARIVVR